MMDRTIADNLSLRNEMKHLNKKVILSDKLKQRCKEQESNHINEKTNLDDFIKKDYYWLVDALCANAQAHVLPIVCSAACHTGDTQ